MNFNYLFSLLVVVLLFLLAWVGVDVMNMKFLFGIYIPYVALTMFMVGFVYRVIDCAFSPVPFRIPTTCGQAESLPWIKQNKIDNPSTTLGVIIRMILEIVCFRSLFRNMRMEFRKGARITYEWEKWLWLGALAFHYTFFVVIVRHMRFFTEPVPFLIQMLENLDGFLQIGIPVIFLSGIILLCAAVYLFLRRVVIPQVRYISLPADYFPLFLIMGIALSGIFMRYFTKVDIVSVKEMTMGLVTFHPVIPEGIGTIFYVHLFLVCTLLAYFPFSKLMHLGGIFFSPTRNLANNNRAVRHVNPWNYPVKLHTYEEYEDEFRERMIEAGLPVEKE
jgi:nitrate reductase gamma subunit